MEKEIKFGPGYRAAESLLFGIGFYFSSIVLIVLVSMVFFGLSFSQNFDAVDPRNLALGFWVQKALICASLFEALLWYFCCSGLKKISARRIFFVCVAVVLILIVSVLLLASRLIFVLMLHFVFATPIGLIVLMLILGRRNAFYARKTG